MTFFWYVIVNISSVTYDTYGTKKKDRRHPAGPFGFNFGVKLGQLKEKLRWLGPCRCTSIAEGEPYEHKTAELPVQVAIFFP